MRSLGGSIGLAIGVIVFNSQIRASTELKNALSPDEMNAILRSPLVIGQLTPQQQGMVSKSFAKAFTQEMRVATYICAACFGLSLLTLQRHPPQLDVTKRPAEREDAAKEQA